MILSIIGHPKPAFQIPNRITWSFLLPRSLFVRCLADPVIFSVAFDQNWLGYLWKLKAKVRAPRHIEPTRSRFWPTNLVGGNISACAKFAFLMLCWPSFPKVFWSLFDRHRSTVNRNSLVHRLIEEAGPDLIRSDAFWNTRAGGKLDFSPNSQERRQTTSFPKLITMQHRNISICSD